jgi:Cft2 family RNA processing exonuclease
MPHPRLSFHGAAPSVTGGCFRSESDHGDILIDCGLYQGSKADKELNFRPIPFAPGKAAAVIFGLAHIDLDISASTAMRLSQASPWNGSLVFASVSKTDR